MGKQLQLTIGKHISGRQPSIRWHMLIVTGWPFMQHRCGKHFSLCDGFWFPDDKGQDTPVESPGCHEAIHILKQAQQQQKHLSALGLLQKPADRGRNGLLREHTHTYSFPLDLVAKDNIAYRPHCSFSRGLLCSLFLACFIWPFSLWSQGLWVAP